MINLLTAERWFGVAFAGGIPNGVCASLVQHETQPKRPKIRHTRQSG